MRWARLRLLIPVGAVSLMSALGIGLVQAQEATPAGGAEQSAAPFPAAIYEGTCDNLATEPTFDLTGASYGIVTPESLAGGLEDATPVTADMAASEETDLVAIGATTLDLNVTRLFVGDRQYAVGVRDPSSGQVLVCGNIGGPLIQVTGQTRTTLDETSIAIALRGQDDSGYSGVAWLRAPEGGVAEETSTSLTIFLIPPEDS